MILVAAALFPITYLLFRWLDERQPNPDDDAVVSDSAGKVLIIISAAVVTLLFGFILPRFGVSFGGIFQTKLNFLPLVRTLLPFLMNDAEKCNWRSDLSKRTVIFA